MNVRFERREQLAPEVWQYYFTPERPVDYAPGQYVALQLLQNFDDPRGTSRTFTLTSLPSDPYISFAVKCAEPLSRYKQVLQTLPPAECAGIGDAMGDLVLPKDPSVPLVFIAGGLGVASFVSMLRSLQESGESRVIHMFYARRTAQDNPFAGLLEQFSFLSRSQYVSPGRLDIASLRNAITPESLVYLSGSETFVESIRTNLEAHGVDHEQIIFDFFDGYVVL